MRIEIRDHWERLILLHRTHSSGWPNSNQKNPLYMHQLGSNAAQNACKIASAQSLHTTVIGFFSRATADDVVSICFEWWSNTDTPMRPVVTKIVSDALFMRPVARFIQQHLEPTKLEWFFTQLYAENELVVRKGVRFLRADLSQTERKRLKIRTGTESLNIVWAN